MNTVTEVERFGARAAGRAERIKFLQGETLTRGQAIRAMCYDCLGGQGYDCEIPTCSLYPYQPYSKSAANQSEQQ